MQDVHPTLCWVSSEWLSCGVYLNPEALREVAKKLPLTVGSQSHWATMKTMSQVYVYYKKAHTWSSATMNLMIASTNASGEYARFFVGGEPSPLSWAVLLQCCRYWFTGCCLAPMVIGILNLSQPSTQFSRCSPQRCERRTVVPVLRLNDWILWFAFCACRCLLFDQSGVWGTLIENCLLAKDALSSAVYFLIKCPHITSLDLVAPASSWSARGGYTHSMNAMPPIPWGSSSSTGCLCTKHRVWWTSSPKALSTNRCGSLKGYIPRAMSPRRHKGIARALLYTW